MEAMEEKQKSEWEEAQKIAIGVDLVPAAVKQLEFLAAIDRRRWLYKGPLLEKAIYRYKTCWLPLLAKYADSGLSEGPLVVPLDCEWIWHCHRLNPVQYKKDCVRIYGKILGNCHVQSSLRAEHKQQAQETWAEHFPQEPFELECTLSSAKCIEKNTEIAENITYDLVSAVSRQSGFFYQVSRPNMLDTKFLREAVSRYRGFLHLIRRNQEENVKKFCVPTYDIDIMWHSHQLHPLEYCNNLNRLLGRVLEHDDTDSDRSKGEKLDVGFKQTTEQYESTFGLRYWKAGVMYRGCPPAALVDAPFTLTANASRDTACRESGNQLLFPPMTAVEVLLEIVAVKNIPDSWKGGGLLVTFTKKQPDLFYVNGALNILSATAEKHVAAFQCEPTGDLILTLKRNTASMLSKTIGTASVSLEEFTGADSRLFIEKWFPVKLKGRHIGSSGPIYLHVAASSTGQVSAPREFDIVQMIPFSLKSLFCSIFDKNGPSKSWTRFFDSYGTEVIRIQMREKGDQGSYGMVVGMKKPSRKLFTVAEFVKGRWSMAGSSFTFMPDIEPTEDGCVFYIGSNTLVKLFAGKRLEFQPKCCYDHAARACHFVTAVEFSGEHPYGRAIGLLDTKLKQIKVNEEDFVLPWMTAAFLLTNLKEENVAAAATAATMKSAGCGGGCSDRSG